MNEVLPRFIFFLSSYVPLLFVFAIKSLSGKSVPIYVDFRTFSAAFFAEFKTPILLSALALCLTALMAQYLRKKARQTAFPVMVEAVARKDADVLAYVVTYIFPFLDVANGGLTNIASQAFLFLVIALIYVNANMIYINPVLNLLGYRIYEVTDNNNKTWSIITRSHYLETKRGINAVSVSDFIALEK